MSRPGYRDAIEWIALNDDEEIGDAETGFIVSVCMVADLWGKEQETVAKAVLTKRKKEGR